MTLDSAVMDLSDAFVAGQGYVALSRVRSLDGLFLRGLNRTALEIDPRVREYDELLSQASARAQERLDGMTPRDKLEKIHTAILRLGGHIERVEVVPKTPK